MSLDWKAMLSSVAPMLGTALGGPIGGVAVSSALAALGIDSGGDDDEEKLETALKSATPEQLLALKNADNNFKRDMKKLDIDVERIASGDRDSARKREISTGDSAPKILAFIIVFGFFSILYTISFIDLPEGAAAPVNILLGALTAMITQVGNYYFGSSASSAKKNDIISAHVSKIK